MRFEFRGGEMCTVEALCAPIPRARTRPDFPAAQDDIIHKEPPAGADRPSS